MFSPFVAVLLTICYLSVDGHGPYEHIKNSWNTQLARVEIDPDIRLIANITVFNTNKQPVLITWNGVSSPSTTDMVAVYVPADAVPWKSVPVQVI